MNIRFEKEILAHFQLPSIPTEKNNWDGVSSFKNGIAVVSLSYEGMAYAACTYDAEKDQAPHVVKSFAQEPFKKIERIIVVPAFMDVNVEKMDLDEESKKAAEMLASEAEEVVQENVQAAEEENNLAKLPEWVFPDIKNAEQAFAYVTAYNKQHKIKGRVPKDEESLKLRLLTIYSETNKNNG